MYSKNIDKESSDLLVSIIMPAYNVEKYIAKSIQSVLRQSYKSWELIIIDDCSDDNTVSIILEFIEDNNISLIRNSERIGAANSRNKGIQAANGDLIAFLDSDDLWNKEKLKKQIKFMISNNFQFTYTSYSLINKFGEETKKFRKVPRKTTYHKLLLYNNIGCLTVIVNSDIAKKNPIRNDILKRNDYAMWLKYLRKVNAYGLKEVLATYRTDSGSISNTRKIKLIKYHYFLFKKSEGFGVIVSVIITFINVLLYAILNKFTYSKNIDKI